MCAAVVTNALMLLPTWPYEWWVIWGVLSFASLLTLTIITLRLYKPVFILFGILACFHLGDNIFGDLFDVAPMLWTMHHIAVVALCIKEFSRD